MKYDVFISYSTKDRDLVVPFVQRLTDETHAMCWIDLEGIESGEEFEEVIVDAIDSSDIVLFMLSDNSLKSKWTKREVNYAEDEGKRVVPVVLDQRGLRGWFKFHFGNVDYINISESVQCDKLFKNISDWCAENRMAEEKKRQEDEARRKAEEEAKRKEEERKKAEAKRIAEEERQKAELQRRMAEEKKRQEEEARRKAEEEAKRKEEERKKAELRRRLEETRIAEAKRMEEEKNRRKEEERKKAEEQRIKEEARKTAELQRRRVEEKKRQEEEARRKAEEEAKCKEEERKKAELRRRLEETRIAEAKRMEAEKKRKAEERKIAEAKRMEEAPDSAVEQYNLARYYEKIKKPAEAVKWYRKAAEQGDAEAQWMLGCYYYMGMGVPRNDSEALKWKLKAAKNGHNDYSCHLYLRRRRILISMGIVLSLTSAIVFYFAACGLVPVRDIAISLLTMPFVIVIFFRASKNYDFVTDSIDFVKRLLWLILSSIFFFVSFLLLFVFFTHGYKYVALIVGIVSLLLVVPSVFKAFHIETPLF